MNVKQQAMAKSKELEPMKHETGTEISVTMWSPFSFQNSTKNCPSAEAGKENFYAGNAAKYPMLQP